MHDFVIFFISTTLLSEGYRCDTQAFMPFTEDELIALRLLLREELQAEVRPFRSEVDKRFAEVATQIDGLYELSNPLADLSHTWL